MQLGMCAGKLVGIISRANLLHGRAARKEKIEAPSTDDRSIRDRVMAVLNQQDWVSHGALNVIVNDGAVEFWGWGGDPEGTGCADGPERRRIRRRHQ